MHAHAWIGGGAPTFTADLTQRRTALQAAFTDALRALADLVVRHGGPAPGLPALTSPVTAMSAPSGAFQGIDPRAMTALVSALDHAGHTLSAAGAQLAGELSAQGLSAQPGQTVGDIARWAATHGEDLRRRLTRIQQAVPWTLLPVTVAAYGLFGAGATDRHGITATLDRLAVGDVQAIRALLALQEQGNEGSLAARVNAWWQTLDTTLRQHLMALPGFGLLNGLPAGVRDQSNRHWLTAEKARSTRELDAATAEARSNPVALGRWEHLADQLRRIQLIEKELQPAPGYPQPLLLGFDLVGLGRLIVSWGDPDTADITVTNVSGLTSKLDTVHGDLQQARALWQQAAKTSGDRTIACITWYGYDAPQIDPTLLNPTTSVAFESAAARGGASLAAFQDGLHAAHQPSGTARAVVIGHSYGSLTTGHAATLRPGKLADDLILVGSPGVGVDHAADLGVDPQHVWVGEAGGDPVAALGRFGADPGHHSFGAQHFPVGRTVWTAAHSSYWDRDSTSLRNMGRLINGQYDKLTAPESPLGRPQMLAPDLAPDLALRLQQVTPP